MDEATLTALLEAVRSGEVAPDDAVHQLRRLPWADLGFARVDHHRALRHCRGQVPSGTLRGGTERCRSLVDRASLLMRCGC